MVMDSQQKRTLISDIIQIILTLVLIALAIWFFSTKTGVLLLTSLIGLLTIAFGVFLANIFQCIMIIFLIAIFIQLRKTNKLLAESNYYLLHGLGDTVNELRHLSINSNNVKRMFRKR